MNKVKCNAPIAILLGAYNSEKYIGEQIESVLAQTFKDWILYVRDDASTDKTKEIIQDYCRKDTRVVLVDDDLGNLGCNGNYFELLSNVSSKYYMFCNSDDFWYPNKIQLSFEEMRKAEDKYPNKGVIIHTDLSISNEKLEVFEYSHWKATSYNPEMFKTYNFIAISSPLFGATMLFNEIVKTNSLPPCGERPFFDQWIGLKNVGKSEIITIYEPTLIYRQIGTNLAAVYSNKEKKLFYKLTHLKKMWDINASEIRTLKAVHWGGPLKYLFYKTLYMFKTFKQYL